jgi:glycine hydroxymethyltransferase
VRWNQASLILVDLTSKHVPGKIAAQALDRAHITTNYNTVPFDPCKPFDPSGLRLGTPAVTTRGMPASEMNPIARWIDEGVEAAERGDEATYSTALSAFDLVGAPERRRVVCSLIGPPVAPS